MFLYIVVFPLLIFATLHASALAVHLANSPELTAGMLSPLWLFAGVLAAVYCGFKVLKFNGSLPLVSSALAICGIGVMLQFRIRVFDPVSMRSLSQAALPLGIAAMLAVYWAGRGGRLAKLERFWHVLLGLAVAVVLFVLMVGSVFRGAVSLKGGINPVEIIKPLLVLSLAGLLLEHRNEISRGFWKIFPRPELNHLVTIGLLWSVPMAMLVLQGDMGMFALMNFTLLAMFYVVTGRRFYFLFGLAAVVGVAAPLMRMTARGAARFAAWSDPFFSTTGSGWQPLHALVALYQGGMFGAGLGAGAPGIVPIVASDFVYVIVGEELGIIGCVCLALLYVVLISSAASIAEKSSDPYRSTVAAGLAACIGFQTLMNVGGVVKAIPLTGIPLPLISHGGSSLVTTFLMLGLLLAISDGNTPGKTQSCPQYGKSKRSAKPKVQPPAKRKISRASARKNAKQIKKD